MAESPLLFLAQSLLEQLNSFAHDEFLLAWGFGSNLLRMNNFLKAITVVLLDAEQPKSRNHRIQVWLKGLNDVLNDIKYLVDESRSKRLTKQEVKDAGNTSRNVKKFFLFLTSNSHAYRFRLTQKLKKLRERVAGFVKLMSDFALTGGINGTQVTVIGRDGDKEKILDHLLNYANVKNVSVLAIVGIAGKGKTTLAKLVYSDERVKSHFEVKLWACISEYFDLKEVLRKISEAATGQNCAGWGTSELQAFLRETVSNKKYLLILDDVQNEHRQKWNKLRALLVGGANGSKILVTTRENSVAAFMHSLPPHHLKDLSHKKCLSLFIKCAFQDEQDVKHYPNLVKIGEEIVRKCKGVPLSVITLGNLLHSITSENEWISVRDSKTWKRKKKENDLLVAQRICYEQYHLYSSCGSDYGSKSFPIQEEPQQQYSACGLLRVADKAARNRETYDFILRSLQTEEIVDITKGNDQEKELKSSPMNSKAVDVAEASGQSPEVTYGTSLDVQSFYDAITGQADDEDKLITIQEGIQQLCFTSCSVQESTLYNIPQYLDGAYTIETNNIGTELFPGKEEMQHQFSSCESDDEIKPFHIQEGTQQKCSSSGLLRITHKAEDVASPFLAAQDYKIDDEILQVSQTGDGTEPFLSEDEMQHQYYSSPGILKVTDKEELGILPPGMHSIRIEDCDALDSLPPEILSRALSLLHLYLINCGSLTSFPVGHHSSMLKTLQIGQCRKLSFYTIETLQQLEHLCIRSSCDSLNVFLLDFFPKLRILCLQDCINLHSLSFQEGQSQNGLKSLESLEIKDCPNFESFPEDGLYAPNLTSIFISNCTKLHSLPIRMLNLKSLQSLFISKCPELESLPADGLPSSLNLLCIRNCDKITLKKECKLNELQALTHFEIEGGCEDIQSFPEVGLLPSSLISLCISRLPHLKLLDQQGFQEFTSLEKLEINCCKRLRFLPEELPSSLSCLSIKGCPLLKANILKKKETDWSMICEIPNVYIDDEEIY